jgi:hypothetical protein
MSTSAISAKEMKENKAQIPQTQLMRISYIQSFRQRYLLKLNSTATNYLRSIVAPSWDSTKEMLFLNIMKVMVKLAL